MNRPLDDPWEIRRAAVLGSFYLWCAGIFLGLCFGKSFLQAISSSSAGALGGLAGWGVYHVVARRNNGLFLVGSGMYGVAGEHAIPFLPAFGLSLVVMVPAGWAYGLYARNQEGRQCSAKSTDPMYDAEVDRAAMR